MTKEEKRQLLIEFVKYLWEYTHSTASFIYWPDAESFLSTFPDEGEKEEYQEDEEDEERIKFLRERIAEVNKYLYPNPMSNTNTVPSAEEFVDANKTMPHIEAMKEYTRLHLEAMRDSFCKEEYLDVDRNNIREAVNTYIKNNKL